MRANDLDRIMIRSVRVSAQAGVRGNEHQESSSYSHTHISIYADPWREERELPLIFLAIQHLFHLFVSNLRIPQTKMNLTPQTLGVSACSLGPRAVRVLFLISPRASTTWGVDVCV